MLLFGKEEFYDKENQKYIIKNMSLGCIYISIIIYLLVFVPLIWGYKPLVVISSSMESNLKVSSILYYHKEDVNNLKKNDIYSI